MGDFPFRKLWHKDFGLDHAVQRMTMDERRRFLWACLMVAPEAAEPGLGTEEEWRDWLDYEAEEWEEHKRNIKRAMKVQGDGRWLQQRVLKEHEEREALREKKAAGGRSRQQKAAGAQHTLADASSCYKTETEIETETESKSKSKAQPASPALGEITQNGLEPDPAERALAFQHAVAGMARAMDLNQHLQKPKKIRSPEEVWAKLEGEPDDIRRRATQLAGWLEKRGVGRNDVIACVDHFADHAAEIANVFAYFAKGSDGFEFATRKAALAHADAEHERLKRS